MLKFIIACAAIVSWPLAVVATWQYFGQSASTDYNTTPHWSLLELIVIWVIALGTGAYIKNEP